MCVKNLNRISVVFFWYWFMHIILEIRVTRLIFNKSKKYKSLFKSYFYVKENVLRVSTWYNCTLYISCKLLIPPEKCRRKRACPLMWLYFFYLFKQFIFCLCIDWNFPGSTRWPILPVGKVQLQSRVRYQNFSWEHNWISPEISHLEEK